MGTPRWHTSGESPGFLLSTRTRETSLERVSRGRTLSKAGYAHFRDFLLYGERSLAGKRALINIFQDTLALEYGEHPLAKYSVEWQEGEEHQSKLRQIGNPRLFDHPYQSPQLELWPSDQVEWFVIIQAHPYGSRPRRKRTARLVVMQPPLLTDGTQG